MPVLKGKRRQARRDLGAEGKEPELGSDWQAEACPTNRQKPAPPRELAALTKGMHKAEPDASKLHVFS
jgi:hypothetical protein